MNIKTFIDQLSVELEIEKPESLSPDTSFREMDDWSSMHALILIAFVDAEYNVTLTGDDLRRAPTVQDLYDIVSAKIAA